MIFLIGATGFLGKPVLEKLFKNGFEVNCLIRTSSDTSELEEASKKTGGIVSFSTGTLNSPDSIITHLKKAEIAVYMVDLEHTDLLNNFIQASSRAGLKRAVFVSSTTVLVPLVSKVKTNKITSENLIMNSGLDYTILRPSMIYGSKDDNNFSKMIDFVKKKGFFVTFGSGNNLIQPVYIEDVAGAIVSTLNNKKTIGQVYEIAGKEPLKYNDMIGIVRSKSGKRFKSIRVPYGLGKFLVSVYAGISRNPYLTPGQIERTGVDKTYSYRKASDDFGFSPISFEEGIEKLIKKLE
jgi:nucleoside-diphosphate-sugar epimerase